jgi:hypothetical protein
MYLPLSKSNFLTTIMLNRIFPAIALTTTFLGVAAQTAHASNYSNASTDLNLQERVNSNRGFYTTTVAGAQWAGSIKITSQQGAAGHYYYKGTFQDSPVGEARVPESSRTTCTGDIDLVRTSNGRGPAMTMGVTWKVTGGKKCNTIGKTFKLQLPEALPQADANGDYRNIWSRWRVVAADGLNCRSQPNGAVVFGYKTGDEIFLDGRLGAEITRSNGASWMATHKPGQFCYVRANSRYIQPVSVPF